MAEPLTDEQLAEIEARASGLRAVESYHAESAGYGGAAAEHHMRLQTRVANARADVLDLLAEVRRLQAENAALEDTIERLRDQLL